MTAHNNPTPLDRKLLTPGAWGLVVLMALGGAFMIYRFLFGLQASTNLDQQWPWGLWIVADVSFIALSAGGFMVAAIAHVFHRAQFHALARPMLFAAMLGYTFACVALLADLGRFYNIWHPILPSMWQGNSALFEVGMCVMCYLTVMWIEFIPAVCERLMNSGRYPALGRVCTLVHRTADKVMFLFIILGVGISFCHQSSIGHIMVLVPSKLHALWYSPILALLFLLSAIAVGFPTAIFVYLLGTWGLKLKPDMAMLASLARYVPFFLGLYLAVKVTDMLIRQSYPLLAEGSVQSLSFIIEMLAGLVAPLVMIMFGRVRKSPRWLGLTCLLIMLGVILNRANVYLIGYHPPFTDKRYFPSLTEWWVTIGSVAAILFLWRAATIYLPIVSYPRRLRTA